MPVSRPTRNAAFILRKTENGCVDFFRFPSRAALAIGLSERCNRPRSTGTSLIKVFSSDSTFLQLQVQSSVQTSHSKWGTVWRLRCEKLVCLDAFSLNGRPLNLRGLLELGDSLTSKGKRYARRGVVYCGYGPVPNVHKSRGGRQYFRNIHTTPERRMNALVVAEDGERPARAARTGGNLPNSWDDIAFSRLSRGWKSQRKSLKAWMG
jgi:hypothetical protein